MGAMITLDNVTYRYPGAARDALRGVSLSVPAGQLCAVVGANGAGKSTLAYAIAGFIPHFFHGTFSGTVTVAGRDTRSAPLHQLARTAGLVLQNPYNQMSGTKFTVREEIAFGLENLGVPRDEMAERVEAAMALVGIADLAERSPLALSGGQMQRVAIAAVLAMQPPVLLLDEATAQLDPAGSREVLAAVRALSAAGQTTVIVIEHKLEWVAAYAERVIVLAQGTVAADGAPAEVLASDALPGYGLRPTRYTAAARLAREQGRWPAGQALPVTLDEAAAAFGRAARDRREAA